MTDDAALPLSEPANSGPSGARRVVLPVLVAVALAVVVLAVANLPSDTRTSTLAIRAAVGLGIGTVLVLLVRRALHALAYPPAASHAAVDARPADVVYECLVCATRVRLEVASTAKPPRHCGEEMESRIG